MTRSTGLQKMDKPAQSLSAGRSPTPRHSRTARAPFSARAAMSEEPGTRELHAGICAGAVE
jgi:hypothetical protein